MSSESHDNIRKRVGKACDRCRLKKSKVCILIPAAAVRCSPSDTHSATVLPHAAAARPTIPSASSASERRATTRSTQRVTSNNSSKTKNNLPQDSGSSTRDCNEENAGTGRLSQKQQADILLHTTSLTLLVFSLLPPRESLPCLKRTLQRCRKSWRRRMACRLHEGKVPSVKAPAPAPMQTTRTGFHASLTETPQPPDRHRQSETHSTAIWHKHLLPRFLAPISLHTTHQPSLEVRSSSNPIPSLLKQLWRILLTMHK